MKKYLIVLICACVVSAAVYSENLEQRNYQLRNQFSRDMQIYMDDTENYVNQLRTLPANDEQQVPQFSGRISPQQLMTDVNAYNANSMAVAEQKYAEAMKRGDKQHACGIAAGASMNSKLMGDMNGYGKWKQMEQNACANTVITNPDERRAIETMKQLEGFNINLNQRMQESVQMLENR